MANRSLNTTPSGPPLKSPPFLLRSRSGASRLCHSASALENALVTSPNVNISTSTTPATRRAVSAARSRSTTRSRFPSDNRVDAPSPQRSQQRDSKENRENHISAIFGKSQKPAGPPHAADAVPSKQRWPTAPASPATSPSAWALSPGRSPTSAEAPEPGDRVKKKSTGRGVLGFLRQKKKAPSPREEAAHQLRILFSRLLQWRFANARAEAAARASKSNAEVIILSFT